MMENSGLGVDPKNRTIGPLPLANDKIDLGKAAQDFRPGSLNDMVEPQLVQIGHQSPCLFLKDRSAREQRNKKHVFLAVKARRHGQWLNATPPDVMGGRHPL